MDTDDLLSARDARAEAVTISGRPGARVLEPSPPAIADGEWYADDPLWADTADGHAPLLPAGMGTDDWDRWADANPEYAAWVASRWLGGPRHLPALPADLPRTRVALHRLATYVVAPARYRANGKFGLRWTLGGFGTPFFADDRQIRVVGSTLIDQRERETRTAPVTSLRAAAEFLGEPIDPDTAAEHDSPALGDPDQTLDVDPLASSFLGEWFGMASAALERVRADAASVDPSRPQIWPGHFDPAIEVGDEDHRASYGASPGDPAIPEPYLYLSVWWPDRLSLDRADPIWNAPSFTGAILRLSDFGDVSGDDAALDPVDVATGFWLGARDAMG